MRLFVYGSLMRGRRHHAELEGARFEAAARTAPGYRLVLAGDYPALVRDAAGAGAVQGEVYDVPVELVARLDEFEGCPELYQREQVELDDGSRASAYLMQHEAVRDCPSITGGAWREPLD